MISIYGSVVLNGFKKDVFMKKAQEFDIKPFSLANDMDTYAILYVDRVLEDMIDACTTRKDGSILLDFRKDVSSLTDEEEQSIQKELTLFIPWAREGSNVFVDGDEYNAKFTFEGESVVKRVRKDIYEEPMTTPIQYQMVNNECKTLICVRRGEESFTMSDEELEDAYYFFMEHKWFREDVEAFFQTRIECEMCDPSILEDKALIDKITSQYTENRRKYDSGSGEPLPWNVSLSMAIQSFRDELKKYMKE